MLELLNGRQSRGLINISFDAASVGSQAIIDKGTLGIRYTRQLFSGATGTDGVINDPTYGKVYKFNNDVRFVGDIIPNFRGMDWQMDIEYVDQATAAHAIWATGDFPAQNNIKAGRALTLNQFKDTTFQLFVTTAAGNYGRYQIDDNVSGLNRMRIQWSNSKQIVVLTNLNTGVSVSQATFDTGADSYWYIGSTHARDGGYASGFIGLLKTLKFSILR